MWFLLPLLALPQDLRGRRVLHDNRLLRWIHKHAARFRRTAQRVLPLPRHLFWSHGLILEVGQHAPLHANLQRDGSASPKARIRFTLPALVHSAPLQSYQAHVLVQAFAISKVRKVDDATPQELVLLAAGDEAKGAISTVVVVNTDQEPLQGEVLRRYKEECFVPDGAEAVVDDPCAVDEGPHASFRERLHNAERIALAARIRIDECRGAMDGAANEDDAVLTAKRAPLHLRLTGFR
mmetsp:Transcript_76050/g.163254  ORF Transcript_76050/g.163254 Transcript_76050/m.163254 type:complete len:237 (-) Transcript_76050:1485-2195(-)